MVPDAPGIGMKWDEKAVKSTRFDVHAASGVLNVYPAFPALAARAAEDARAAAGNASTPTSPRAPRAIRSARRSTTTAAALTYARAQARGRRARRLPAAALRRGARRSRAALCAELPAVHHRLLRDPARRRGGGAGQPDEPHRGAAPLRRGFRCARRDRRPGRAARDRAAAAWTHVLPIVYSDYLERGDRPAGARLRARAAGSARRGRTRLAAHARARRRTSPARTTSP